MEGQAKVTKIDKIVKQETLYEDLKYLCALVKPGWKNQELVQEKLTGGMMNQVFRCSLKTEDDDSLAVRIYTAKNACNLIDHGYEIIGMQVGFAAGVSQPLHIIFNNGMVYGYAPGQLMRWGCLWDDHLARKFMNALAKLHSTDLAQIDLIDKDGKKVKMEKKFSFLDRMRQTVRSLPEEFKHFPERKQIMKERFWSKERLLNEMDLLEKLFASFSFDVVFSHMDCWVSNILYDKDTDKVTMIDYENCDYNYEAYDLAFLFNCFQWFEQYKNDLPEGPVKVSDDEMKLPRDDNHKRKLARIYLEEKYRIRGEKPESSFTEEEFEKFYTQALMLEIFIFLYWTLFPLGQFDDPLVNFDIVQAAEDSFKNYLRYRDQLFSYQNVWNL